MSLSDSEEEVTSLRRPSRPALFNASPSPSNSDLDLDSPPPPQARRAARQDKASALLASTRRAAPRFLGDDGDDDGGDDGLDDLFGDLSSVANARPRASVPARLDARAGQAAFADAPASAPASGSAALGGQGVDSVWLNGDENGVDGVVAKKRRVVAKLDDVRLLGPSGFPKLMSDVKRVRLKGKGHERSDLKRVLSMYQLWAHQMYPKFNLKDSLAAVEKLCHKRTVQSELRRYRHEAKEAAQPKPSEIGGDLPADAAPLTTTDAAAAVAELEALGDDDMFDFDEDEEAMLAELEGGASGPGPARPAAPRPPPPTAKAAVREEEDFDAMEEEALRAVQEEFDIDEDEEAMLREMDEMM